jgi:PAS domain S-box-containing protein
LLVIVSDSSPSFSPIYTAMKSLNPKLQKQLLRHFGGTENVPGDLKPLLRDISAYYSEQEGLFNATGFAGDSHDYGAQDPLERERNRRILAEEQLKLAESIANFGRWQMDMSESVAEWSDELCAVYGLPAYEKVHTLDTWASFIHPEDKAVFLKIMTGAVADLGGVAEVYHRIITADGSVRHLHTRAKYTVDSGGMPALVQGISQDVTDTLEARDALVRSQANLKMLIDLIPQAIYARDEHGRFVFVNETYANLFGMEPEQLLNKDLEEILPVSNDLHMLMEEDMQVLQTKHPLTIPESSFSDYRGNVRKYHTIKVPFSTTENEDAVLGISQDITEQLKVDNERRKIIKDLMQRNNSLEQFSYIISHNLRAPVANILGIAKVLEEAEVSERERQFFTDSLYKAVQRLDAIIKDLNNILQVKNQINEKKEIILFSELTEGVKASINEMIVAAHTDIICDFTHAETVRTVKSYMHSIFLNLITNSIKYRKPDEPPVIHITTKRANGITEIVFTDNGLGMDIEKHREELFGLYKRFHTHTEGRGMGLYMVKTQVETLGGRITVSSKENEGTKFRIELE